jgi:hypothetical protein
MQLSFDQIRKYFEHRHPGQRIGTRNKADVKCAHHDDRSASCTLFLDGAGGYNCHACGSHGNIFQFEAKFSSCTLAEAETKVAEITGATANFGSFAKLGPVIAAYDYRDSDGTVLYQKRRYHPEGEGKTFRIYRPSEAGNWLAGIDPEGGEPAKRVLYNLTQLVTANVAIVCEGEKDCDNVSQCGLWQDRSSLRVAVTCNFEGAWKPGQKSKWLTSYNSFFAGKLVVIFVDHDENGEIWAQTIAENIHHCAHQVKLVRLPGLQKKGDVSDWLAAGHTAKELESEIAKAPAWHPTEKPSHVLVPAPDFVSATPEEMEYLIDGVIPKDGNGFVVAVTKGRKSWSAVDMLISMALGEPWLGFNVPRPVRCALVSREDSPSLTAWRMGHLIRGKKAKHPELLEANLFVNSRAQTPQFMLDNPAQVSEMIAEFKKRRIEFAIFDVFNVLHSVDENDNTQMRTILQALSSFQIETGCSIGVVHHFGKMETASLVHRMRGASAIAGWAEWLIGLTLEDEDAGIVKVEFKSKASAQTPPVYFEIESGNGVARLQPVARPEAKKQTGRRPLQAIVQERERRDLQ